VWLCSQPAREPRERAALLRAADNRAEKLLAKWEKISPLLIKKEKIGLYKEERSTREREADAILADLKAKDRFVIFPGDQDYPHEEFRFLSAPPIVLFGEGNRALMKTEKFCIVGSRILPPWAEKKGRAIAESVARRFTVVTGLAEGGDSAAIAGAIGSGKLISVLPSGLDNCYPAAHTALKERVKESGLVLSEYPLKEKAKRYSFHARNRLLAALANRGTLVLAAGERSGTLITAHAALEYGREVFALPYNVGAAQGEGCNELIKTGAHLTTGAEDIFSLYGIELRTEPKQDLPPEEEKVLGVLREAGELHVSEIAERAGMRIYEAAAVLSALEIKNLAVKSGGNRYGAV
ncbi:MAG: DNA-protecting protein DprA, partial [Clostridia bacterium]|nr:DNA-protecting protein DprA [Clostridia bacterium]